MKNVLRLFGLITLICFSFFYTERVMTVVSEHDPLKKEINECAVNYKIVPNEAIITEDTIIPGNNGREVNVEKSYKKMKSTNIFNDNLLVYNIIPPKYTLANCLDKYVIRGSVNKKEVSLVFIIKNNNHLSKVINVLDSKKIIGNFFVDYNYLNNNISEMREYINHNLYSYQDEYTYDKLLISNNIIKRISNNNPSFCLTKEKNINNLNLCSYVNMNIIIPSIEGSLKEIKNNLDNGSIILFDININTSNELSYMIDFIVGKGYEIVGIDKLLEE